MDRDEIENILYAQEIADKLPHFSLETYQLKADCVNCGAIYDDYSAELEGTYPDLEIPKGTLLAQVKCKFCGCQTLKRRK